MISLVIYGSRNAFPTDDVITHHVTLLLDGAFPDVLLCGMAKGADACGLAWAQRLCVPVVQMPADWSRGDKLAGYRRNDLMAQRATHGLGFWRDSSGGTAHMTTCLVAYEKIVRVVRS